MSINKSKKSRKNKKYSDGELFLAAKPFKTRTEFARNDSGAYSAAQDRKMLDDVCAFMGPKSNKRYLDEELKEIISQYTYEQDLIENNESVYRIAKKRKLYTKYGAHLIKTQESWAREKVLSKSIKCKDREEFYTKENKAYHAAKRLECYDEAVSHMPLSEKEPRKNDELRVLALSCNNVDELKDKDLGAYCAIMKRNLSDTYFSHMKRAGNRSKPERELMAIIKEKYPSAIKLKDNNVKIEGKPHACRFEIDIFIPELNLGIEYDGKWHHSPEFLAKTKGKWPLEDALNKAQIKDDYFMITKGIKILHIKNADWRKNKDLYIKQCLEFLGQK